MEKGKCCGLLYQQAGQVTEQGEPGGPGEATPTPHSKEQCSRCGLEQQCTSGVAESDFFPGWQKCTFPDLSISES